VPVVVAGSGGSVPCWKQRTKSQWLAWMAARLWRVLDAFYVTLFLTLSPERLVITTSEPWVSVMIQLLRSGDQTTTRRN
jgi:hypothetical protein